MTDFPFNFCIVDLKDSFWRETNARLDLDFNFTLISLNLYAFFKQSQRAKIEKRGQRKEDKRVKEGKKRTDFPFNFCIADFVSG